MSDAKPAVGFYHLTRFTVEEALPKLLEVILRQFDRIVVRAASQQKIDKLDTALWTYDKDSFLPHGTDRNDHADLQPVLLTTSEGAANNAQVLVLLDGILPETVDAYQRIVYVFDGGNDEEVQRARTHWTAFKARNLSLTYFQQNDAGGWAKTAEG
jgi:DNA polymerase III subunit chi